MMRNDPSQSVRLRSLFQTSGRPFVGLFFFDVELVEQTVNEGCD